MVNGCNVQKKRKQRADSSAQNKKQWEAKLLGTRTAKACTYVTGLSIPFGFTIKPEHGLKVVV